MLDGSFGLQSWSRSLYKTSLVEPALVDGIAESLSTELRTALQGCFITYAQRTRQAAGLLPDPAAQAEQEQEDHTQQPAAPVTDASLLILHTSCAQVRTSLLPHVLSRYYSVVYQGTP